VADTSSGQPTALTAAEEEDLFYHEAGLNASWTGIRLALGALSFLFGAFVFAFFYLRSLDSYHLWYTAQTHPSMSTGTLIMAFVVGSAVIQAGVLQLIKGGNKAAWQAGALVALLLGLAAVGLMVWQLATLSFPPGASGFASVFVGFYPVYLTIVFGAMVWLETLIVRCVRIPQISFVEQPPTYAEAFEVQRFQASLSAFTVAWNYLAGIGLLAWILFYLVH
jgi:hypothetical protein